MSRANEGRTETIKQRRVDVYLPSLEVKAAWGAEAEKRGLSLSEMMFFLVREALAGEATDARSRAAALEKQVESLAGKAADLEQRNAMLQTLNERMEKDLGAYRARAFLGSSPVQKIDPRLVRVLSEAKDRDGKHRPVGEVELRKSLRFTTAEAEVSQAIARQLVFLESHDVIKKTATGWVWNG